MPLSSTAVPSAVSQPKNADPHLVPPNRSRCSCFRARRCSRAVATGATGAIGAVGPWSVPDVMRLSLVAPVGHGQVRRSTRRGDAAHTGISS